MKKINTLTKLTVIAATGVVASPLTALNVKADTVEDSSNQVEIITQTVAVKEPSLEEVKSQIVSAEATTAEAKATYDNVSNQVAQSEADLAAATSQNNQAKETIAATATKLTATQSELPAAETALEEAQASYNQTVTENPTLAADLEKAEAEKVVAEEEQAQSEVQLAEATKEKETATKSVESTEAQITATETGIDTAQTELVSAKAEVSASEASLAAAKDKLAETQATVSTKTAELEASVANAGQDTIVSTRNVQVASIDGSQRVENTKSANHEQVLYSGTKTIEKELTPDQLQEYKEKGYFTYSPDAKAVSQYMVTLLKELRTLNGIDIPVPGVSAEALDYAQKRADEILANRVLSHDTKYDQTCQNSENAGIINYSKTSDNSNAILSDEQLAYHLLNTYFADYENLYAGYGHRITLLTGSGDGFGNAFAGRYHTMEFMDYNGVTNTATHSQEYWEVMQGFTYASDAENTMYFNGKRLTFLPRTTFTYITKVTETTPNAVKLAAEKALTDYKETAQLLLTTAQDKVKQAEVKVTSVKASQATVQDRLVNLRSQLKSLTEELTTAKTKLQAVEKTEAGLREKVILAKADTASKSTALADLTLKASSLVVAKDKLKAAEEKVVTLKETISTLTDKLAQAKADKEASQATIEELTSGLIALLPKRDAAKVNFDKASEELAKLKSQLATLEAKAILATVSTRTPNINNVTEAPKVKPLASSTPSKYPVAAGQSVSNTEKALPATGESSNAFVAGLGLLLSIAGIVKLRKKVD